MKINNFKYLINKNQIEFNFYNLKIDYLNFCKSKSHENDYNKLKFSNPSAKYLIPSSYIVYVLFRILINIIFKYKFFNLILNNFFR